jgi:phytoene/squalene synthetase
LVAAGFRYDYVDSVHEYISQIKALSKYCWYVGVLGVLLAVLAREIEFNNKNAASIVLGIRFCNSLVTRTSYFLHVRTRFE